MCIRDRFQSAGWDLQPGGDSTSDTVTKGWQELYLHPMNFSGLSLIHISFLYHLYDDRGLDVLGGSQKLLLPLYHQFHDWILEYDLEKIDQM